MQIRSCSSRVIILLLGLTALLEYPVVLCQHFTCRVYCDNKVAVYGGSEICLEKQWCKHNRTTETGESNTHNLYAWENATFVRLNPNIGNFGLKRCSVKNFKRLEILSGENSDLALIEVAAFWNLPSLKVIYLAFNKLREIQSGIFNHLPVKFLDLSWNKIGYISEKAFEGMENLKTLNISHNELVTLDMLDYDFHIDELLLSHNFLETINLSYKQSIGTLDLSFNKLTDFDVHTLSTFDVVDLTSNYLSTFIGVRIKHLRLSLNNLADISPLYDDEDDLIIETITLYPNPWDCEELETLLTILQKSNVKILNPNITEILNTVHDYPVCANVKEEAYYNYNNYRKRLKGRQNCQSDNQCPKFMICRTGECYDPCKQNACHSDIHKCATYGHKFTCKCPLGTLGRPFHLFPTCVYPCRVDSDCVEGLRTCGKERFCIK